MTTFTIGKHRMRNGEEATVSFIGPDGTLFGYRGKDAYPTYWLLNGKWAFQPASIDDDEHPWNLLPPSPPKLEPSKSLTAADLAAICEEARRSIGGNGAAFSGARIALQAIHRTIHKRTTEQVED